MTYQQLSYLRLTHTLSQNCGACYDNYLDDKGRHCEEYERLYKLVPDGVVDPGIPSGPF